MIDFYETGGHREAMLRFGPDSGPVAVVALPLFEEANRTRAFAVAICRALAERGVASVLPDLPGQGESLVPLEECGIADIALGLDDATKARSNADRPLYGVAIRSAALLDRLAPLRGRWHLAPQSGSSLLRDIKRIKQASAPRGVLDDLWYSKVDAPEAPLEIAGNLVSTDLLTALTIATPWTAGDGGYVRTVRLESDPKPADRHVPGPPLWRRAEPGNDLPLAALLADDIADWIAACEG